MRMIKMLRQLTLGSRHAKFLTNLQMDICFYLVIPQLINNN